MRKDALKDMLTVAYDHRATVTVELAGGQRRSAYFEAGSPQDAAVLQVELLGLGYEARSLGSIGVMVDDLGGVR